MNAEEIWDHFASQNVLNRIIGRSRLQVSLSFTPREIDWSTLPLKDDILIHNGESKLVLYGKNRVLAQEMDVPRLVERNQSLSDKGATFFELDNYQPHFVLDFNLAEEIEWEDLEPFTDPVILEEEIISESNTNFRNTIRYRNLQ